ncbi:MAG: GDSL-type esterase/lipase family protein [Candidatus Omnitrophota bacterium]|nr:GDSL-type esterase/lipase family protein [Candidatus Omnitrophota bacterium]
MKNHSCKFLKIILLFTLCFLLFSFLLGYVKREIKNIDSRGKNIICFGDSLTFGYGAEQGEDYPSALSKMTDIPVINAGLNSDTSSAGLIRIEADVLNKEPLLVIIEFCGNDFLKKIPQEETIRNIEKMIDLCLQKKAMVALVDISAGMFFKEYCAAFSKLSRAKKIIFIPAVLSKILTNPGMKSDFLHPNAAGYILVAQRIYKAIKPYLTQTKDILTKEDMGRK